MKKKNSAKVLTDGIEANIYKTLYWVKFEDRRKSAVSGMFDYCGYKYEPLHVFISETYWR